MYAVYNPAAGAKKAPANRTLNIPSATNADPGGTAAFSTDQDGTATWGYTADAGDEKS
jgi:hypothetical protein